LQSFEESGIVFRIQLLALSEKVELSDNRLKGLDGVEIYVQKSMYKYTVGTFNNLSETSDLLSEVLDKGFGQAFIVAFNNGKRIPVKQAIELMKN
jgi:N-acetylmuramoyl-L-alanine amidase